MAYYHRAAGKAQGKMLAYARDYLDKNTYERLIKANRRVTIGIYIYMLVLMCLLFAPIAFLGKMSIELSMIFILGACFSPIIYFLIYYKTFGKEWNQYVKWYKNSDRTVAFTFDGEAVKTYPVGIANAKIADVRGDMYSVRIIYDNGYEIKASGELFPGGKFIAYNRSLKKWEAPHDAEEFTFEDAKKIIKDMIDSYDIKKVDVVFDGDFSIADMRGRATRNCLVKYSSGIEGVSDTWRISLGDVDFENRTVKLRFYQGHLPGWKVEDKIESSKIVSLDEITGYAIEYCYIYSTKAGQRVSEYSREIPCDWETICEQG